MSGLVGKTLYDFFSEKFENNLKPGETYQDTFNRTSQEIGFDAYSSYTSYATTRRARRKSGRKR
jgi:hypothetical protein